MNYSSFFRRLSAYMIDVLFILLIVLVIHYLFFDFDTVLTEYIASKDDLMTRARFLDHRNKIRDATFLIWILESLFFECSPLQGTPGKWIAGIKVVDLFGERLSFAKSLKRSSVKILGAIPIFLGYAWCIYREDRATWHDILASTRVIERE